MSGTAKRSIPSCYQCIFTDRMNWGKKEEDEQTGG